MSDILFIVSLPFVVTGAAYGVFCLGRLLAKGFFYQKKKEKDR